MFSIKGKIIKVLSPVGGISQKGNEWKRQTFVIEFEIGSIKKTLAFDVLNDKCIIPDIGKEVIVSFGCESREYNDKWFSSIIAYSVEEDLTAPIANPGEPKVTPIQAPKAGSDEEENSDLPF